MTRSEAATLGAGGLLALVSSQALDMFGGGSPALSAPAPFILVLPMVFGVPLPLVAIGWMVAFWLCSRSLFRGEPTIPRYLPWLLIAVAVLSAAWYLYGFGFAIQYWGLKYAVGCLSLSVMMLAACSLAIWRSRRSPTFAGAFLAPFLLFWWLASYAFPWLGEGI